MFITFAACGHPNRMYRIGCKWYCFYCCCPDYYNYSRIYYSSRPKFVSHCQCGCDNCTSNKCTCDKCTCDKCTCDNCGCGNCGCGNCGCDKCGCDNCVRNNCLCRLCGCSYCECENCDCKCNDCDCKCNNCHCNSDSFAVLSFIFFIIIIAFFVIVILVYIIIILMFILHQLCSSDDDELMWETSQFNNSIDETEKNELKMTFIPKNDSECFDPQIINPNVDDQPCIAQQYDYQKNQTDNVQQHNDQNIQNAGINLNMNPYDDFYPPPPL